MTLAEVQRGRQEPRIVCNMCGHRVLEHSDRGCFHSRWSPRLRARVTCQCRKPKYKL